MAAIESVLLRYCNNQSGDLFKRLRPLLNDEATALSSTAQCTKRCFSLLCERLNKELRVCDQEHVCILLEALRGLACPENTNFNKFFSYGLPGKQWLTTLSSHSPQATVGWYTVMNDLLFTVQTAAEYSSSACAQLHVLIPGSLRVAGDSGCVVSSRMEACRSLNVLLDNCSVEKKDQLKSKANVFDNLQKTGSTLNQAGDYELQSALLEVLFRFSSDRERVIWGRTWFGSLSNHFVKIRENEFESDCRIFLNALNLSCGEKRRVHSLHCLKSVVGDMELHQPPDSDKFWCDVNLASKCISMYVADPSNPQGMWETVLVPASKVKSWTTKDVGAQQEFCFSLSSPLILPWSPSPRSSTITFSFSTTSTALTAVSKVFGNPSRRLTRMKASVACVPLVINYQRQHTSLDSNQISPISPNVHTPAVNPSISSQHSTTPTQPLPPQTPHTSTPRALKVLSAISPANQVITTTTTTTTSTTIAGTKRTLTSHSARDLTFDDEVTTSQPAKKPKKHQPKKSLSRATKKGAVKERTSTMDAKDSNECRNKISKVEKIDAKAVEERRRVTKNQALEDKALENGKSAPEDTKSKAQKDTKSKAVKSKAPDDRKTKAPPKSKAVECKPVENSKSKALEDTRSMALENKKSKAQEDKKSKTQEDRKTKAPKSKAVKCKQLENLKSKLQEDKKSKAQEDKKSKAQEDKKSKVQEDKKSKAQEDKKSKAIKKSKTVEEKSKAIEEKSKTVKKTAVRMRKPVEKTEGKLREKKEGCKEQRSKIEKDKLENGKKTVNKKLSFLEEKDSSLLSDITNRSFNTSGDQTRLFSMHTAPKVSHKRKATGVSARLSPDSTTFNYPDSPHLKSGKITRDCPNRSHSSTIELVMESQPPEVIEEEKKRETTFLDGKGRHAKKRINDRCGLTLPKKTQSSKNIECSPISSEDSDWSPTPMSGPDSSPEFITDPLPAQRTSKHGSSPAHIPKTGRRGSSPALRTGRHGSSPSPVQAWTGRHGSSPSPVQAWTGRHGSSPSPVQAWTGRHGSSPAPRIGRLSPVQAWTGRHASSLAPRHGSLNAVHSFSPDDCGIETADFESEVDHLVKTTSSHSKLAETNKLRRSSGYVSLISSPELTSVNDDENGSSILTTPLSKTESVTSRFQKACRKIFMCDQEVTTGAISSSFTHFQPPPKKHVVLKDPVVKEVVYTCHPSITSPCSSLQSSITDSISGAVSLDPSWQPQQPVSRKRKAVLTSSTAHNPTKFFKLSNDVPDKKQPSRLHKPPSLINSVKLNTTGKPAQSNARSLSTLAVVWNRQQQERFSLLTNYQKLLLAKLTVLEGSKHHENPHILSLFKQQLKKLTGDRRTQDNYLCELQALYEGYFQDLSQVEISQANEQTKVQLLLKREYIQQQQQALSKSQKRHISHFKQSFEALLLQL